MEEADLGTGTQTASTAHGIILQFARRRFHFDPVFLGLCLVVSLSTSISLFSGNHSDTPELLPDLPWLGNALRVVLFTAIALGSARITPLSGHRHLPWVAAGLSAAGSALYVLSVGWTSSLGLADTAYTVGLVCNAVGYVVLYMCWLELYAKMDLPHVITYFALVHLCSAALSYAISLVTLRWLAAACIVALPVASVALYRVGLRHAQDAPFMQGEQTVTGWSFPVRPIVLLATFTFANVFIRHFLTTAGAGTALLGVVGAALVVIAVEWALNSPDIQVLYSLCLPLIVAAAFCVLMPAAGFGIGGALLSNAAYTVFSIFATALLCGLCFRSGVEPLWLFGFAQAAISLGSLLSSILTNIVDFSAVDSTTLTVTVGAVVLVFVCLYAFTSGEGTVAASWGIRQTGGNASGTPAPEPLEDRCARLARQYGLTRREEEVLVLLARNEALSQIEDELSISNSTLKTHTRHIYAKLGVAGKREIAELIGQ